MIIVPAMPDERFLNPWNDPEVQSHLAKRAALWALVLCVVLVPIGAFTTLYALDEIIKAKRLARSFKADTPSQSRICFAVRTLTLAVLVVVAWLAVVAILVIF